MSSSGLANALDDLAGASDEVGSSSTRRTPEPTPDADDSTAGMIVGEIDDESGEIEGSAPYAGGASAHKHRPRASASARRRKSQSNDGLKQVAAPVLLTTGLLLLVPAVWAVLQLSGLVTSEKDDANTMAMAMLIAWPMALILIAAGGWFVWQVVQAKKQASD